MKVVRLKTPASVASLHLVEEDPPVPKAGEVLVRVRASSLNPHDDFVVRGVISAADGRVPLSDGAGEVLACGEGVTELSVGDAVVSTFWPYWLSGDMTASTRRDIPGESVDGYAREYACMPAHAFTRAPPGFSHAEAATLTCSGLTAWRGGCRADQEDMIRSIHVNRLKPVIDRSFGLEQISTAFEHYQTRSHFGKITIEI